MSVIKGNSFFIMEVYGERKSFHDYMKRACLQAFVQYLYVYLYIRVPYGSIEKEMFRQFHTGYGIRWYPADLHTASTADIRMPCLRGSVTRKMSKPGKDMDTGKMIIHGPPDQIG